MKYQIIGKNITVTKGISSAIEKKLSKMDKYFDPNEEVECRAVVSAYQNGDKVEVTIRTKDVVLRTETKNPDLYAAVDLTIDKLEGQMRKLKTKMKKRYEREGIGKAILYDQILDEKLKDEKNIEVKTKSYKLTPITLDEAILEMESVGHDFYVYLDSEDEKVSIVYKRKEGGYGLIQVENNVVL